MVTIRPLRPGEGATLLAMTRELAESHDSLADLTAEPEMIEKAFFNDNPVCHALIAEWQGAPAGCAIWHRSYSSFRGREVMYLEDVAVLPAFRRRGIAKALFKEVAKVAVAHGYPGIAWLMMDWNDGARKLYESLGAELEQGIIFCRLHGEALTKLAASE